MHLHYVEAPPAVSIHQPSPGTGVPVEGAPKTELGLIETYRAKLGILPPSSFGTGGLAAAAASDAASAADTPARGGAAGGGGGGGGGGSGTSGCLSPEPLPPPMEAWRLLGQKYTYDWWSKSATKDVQFVPDDKLLLSEDILLALTVTAVPHTAYDGNRHEMTVEDVEAAAAALPVDRLIQRSAILVEKRKPFKNEEEAHSLLFGGEENREKEPTLLQLSPPDLCRATEGDQKTLGWIVGLHAQGEPLTLSLSFGVGSVHAWLVQSQMAGVQRQQMQLGLQSDKEAFMFKRILLETNPFMLTFSALFILCHSVFSFFAFKNDMQFWYKNESMEGLSAASLIFGFVCELVIGLYLFDSQETSWLILFEVFVGVAISAWKLTKAIRMEKQEKFPFVKLAFTRSYSDSKTKDFDRTAITYASIALVPCLVGYAIYALLHNKYRSWYSYVISVLAGSVYTFGFVLMTPQLYINYKLKSVDHLPWRALIYRSLNTFVDDVASFLIDMPWMHRLSCFRDGAGGESAETSGSLDAGEEGEERKPGVSPKSAKKEKEVREEVVAKGVRRRNPTVQSDRHET
ncbi:hypothetical protein ACSSS7_005564 [Eimeria intestinalis]